MSIGSVAAGYAAMVVLVMLGTIALTAAVVPGGVAAMRARVASPDAGRMPVPSASYVAGNIALSLVAALVGGWITARLAPRAPVGHLVALCFVMLAMGLVSARMPQAASQPAWYRLAIPLIGIAGVALSAVLVPPSGG